MLRTYSKGITATANTPIVLNTNKILTGTTVSHANGSGDIVVNTPGYYMVTVNADLTSTGATSATLTLNANGTPIVDGTLTTTLVASEVTNAGFTTIVYAKPSSINNTVALTLLSNVDLSNLDIFVGINRLG